MTREQQQRGQDVIDTLRDSYNWGAAVRSLIAAGADLHVYDPLTGFTCVHMLVKRGTGGLRVLIENGADINARVKGDIDRTPLSMAVMNDRPGTSWETFRTVRSLLECGADVNRGDSVRGWTPLIEAVASGGFYTRQNVALLLSYGADVLRRDNDGLTALDHAREAAGKGKGVHSAAVLALIADAHEKQTMERIQSDIHHDAAMPVVRPQRLRRVRASGGYKR